MPPVTLNERRFTEDDNSEQQRPEVNELQYGSASRCQRPWSLYENNVPPKVSVIDETRGQQSECQFSFSTNPRTIVTRSSFEQNQRQKPITIPVPPVGLVAGLIAAYVACMAVVTFYLEKVERLDESAWWWWSTSAYYAILAVCAAAVALLWRYCCCCCFWHNDNDDEEEIDLGDHRHQVNRSMVVITCETDTDVATVVPPLPPSSKHHVTRLFCCYAVSILCCCALLPAMPWRQLFITGAGIPMTIMNAQNSTTSNTSLSPDENHFFDLGTDDESIRGRDLAQVFILLFIVYCLVRAPPPPSSTVILTPEKYTKDKTKHHHKDFKCFDYLKENNGYVTKTVIALSLCATVVYLVLSVIVAANRYRPHHGGYGHNNLGNFPKKIVSETSTGFISQIMSTMVVLIAVNVIGFMFHHTISKVHQLLVRDKLDLHRNLCLKLHRADEKLNQLIRSLVPRRIFWQVKRDVVAGIAKMECYQCRNQSAQWYDFVTNSRLQNMYVKDYEKVAVAYIRVFYTSANSVVLRLAEHFDLLARNYHCRLIRVQADGQCFVFVAGLPDEENYLAKLNNNHTMQTTANFCKVDPTIARRIIDVTLDAIRAVEMMTLEMKTKPLVSVGMDVGRVSCGVTGGLNLGLRWQYEVWGPAVTVARCAMELSSQVPDELKLDDYSLLATESFMISAEKCPNNKKPVDTTEYDIHWATDDSGILLVMDEIKCFWLTPKKPTESTDQTHVKNPERQDMLPPLLPTIVNSTNNVHHHLTIVPEKRLTTPIVANRHRRTRRDNQQNLRHPPQMTSHSNNASLSLTMKTVQSQQQNHWDQWEHDVFVDYDQLLEDDEDVLYAEKQIADTNKLLAMLRFGPTIVNIIACLALVAVLMLTRAPIVEYPIHLWSRRLATVAAVWMIITAIVTVASRFGWFGPITTVEMKQCCYEHDYYADEKYIESTDSDNNDDDNNNHQCLYIRRLTSACWFNRHRQQDQRQWRRLCGNFLRNVFFHCMCRSPPLSLSDTNCNTSTSNGDIENNLQSTRFRFYTGDNIEKNNDTHRQLLHMNQLYLDHDQVQGMLLSKLPPALTTMEWFEASCRVLLLLLVALSFVFGVMAQLIICEPENNSQQYVAVSCFFALITITIGMFYYEDRRDMVEQVMKKLFVALAIIIITVVIAFIAAIALKVITVTGIDRYLSPCHPNTTTIDDLIIYQNNNYQPQWLQSSLVDSGSIAANLDYHQEQQLQRKYQEQQRRMQEIIVKQHQKQYYKQSQKKRYAFAATTVVQVFMFAAVVILLHAYINYLVRCLQRSLAKTKRLTTKFKTLKFAHRRTLLFSIPEHVVKVISKGVQQRLQQVELNNIPQDMAAIAAVHQKYEHRDSDLTKSCRQSDSDLMFYLKPLYWQDYRSVTVIYAAIDVPLMAPLYNEQYHHMHDTSNQRSQERELWNLMGTLVADFDALLTEPEFSGRVVRIATSGQCESYIVAIGLHRQQPTLLPSSKKYNNAGGDSSNYYDTAEWLQCRELDETKKMYDEDDQNNTDGSTRSGDGSSSSDNDGNHCKLSFRKKITKKSRQKYRDCMMALDFVWAMRQVLNRRVEQIINTSSNQNTDSCILFNNKEGLLRSEQIFSLRVGIDVSPVTATLYPSNTGQRLFHFDLVGDAVVTASELAGGPGMLGTFREVEDNNTRVSHRVRNVVTGFNSIKPQRRRQTGLTYCFVALESDHMYTLNETKYWPSTSRQTVVNTNDKYLVTKNSQRKSYTSLGRRVRLAELRNRDLHRRKPSPVPSCEPAFSKPVSLIRKFQLIKQRVWPLAEFARSLVSINPPQQPQRVSQVSHVSSEENLYHSYRMTTTNTTRQSSKGKMKNMSTPITTTPTMTITSNSTPMTPRVTLGRGSAVGSTIDSSQFRETPQTTLPPNLNDSHMDHNRVVTPQTSIGRHFVAYGVRTVVDLNEEDKEEDEDDKISMASDDRPSSFNFDNDDDDYNDSPISISSNTSEQKQLQQKDYQEQKRQQHLQLEKQRANRPKFIKLMSTTDLQLKQKQEGAVKSTRTSVWRNRDDNNSSKSVHASTPVVTNFIRPLCNKNHAVNNGQVSVDMDEDENDIDKEYNVGNSLFLSGMTPAMSVDSIRGIAAASTPGSLLCSTDDFEELDCNNDECRKQGLDGCVCNCHTIKAQQSSCCTNCSYHCGYNPKNENVDQLTHTSVLMLPVDKENDGEGRENQTGKVDFVIMSDTVSPTVQKKNETIACLSDISCTMSVCDNGLVISGNSKNIEMLNSLAKRETNEDFARVNQSNNKHFDAPEYDKCCTSKLRRSLSPIEQEIYSRQLTGISLLPVTVLQTSPPKNLPGSSVADYLETPVTNTPSLLVNSLTRLTRLGMQNMINSDTNCSGLSKKSDPSSYGDLNRLESEAVIAKRHRSDEQLLEASSKRVERDQMKLAAAESIDQQVPVRATLCENQTNEESLKRERMLEARVIRDQTLPNDRVSRRYLPISEAAHHDNDAQEHGERFTSMINSDNENYRENEDEYGAVSTYDDTDTDAILQTDDDTDRGDDIDNMSTMNDGFLTDVDAAMSDLNSTAGGYTTTDFSGSMGSLSVYGATASSITSGSFYGGESDSLCGGENDSYYDGGDEDDEDFTNEWMDGLERLLGSSQRRRMSSAVDNDDDDDDLNRNNRR